LRQLGSRSTARSQFLAANHRPRTGYTASPRIGDAPFKPASPRFRMLPSPYGFGLAGFLIPASRTDARPPRKAVAG